MSNADVQVDDFDTHQATDMNVNADQDAQTYAPLQEYKILYGQGPQKISLSPGQYTVVVEVMNLLSPIYMGQGIVDVKAGSFNKLTRRIRST